MCNDFWSVKSAKTRPKLYPIHIDCTTFSTTFLLCIALLFHSLFCHRCRRYGRRRYSFGQRCQCVLIAQCRKWTNIKWLMSLQIVNRSSGLLFIRMTHLSFSTNLLTVRADAIFFISYLCDFRTTSSYYPVGLVAGEHCQSWFYVWNFDTKKRM